MNDKFKIWENNNTGVINNNVKNGFYEEIYVPKKYGSKYNNTFVMEFYQPTICDYLKRIFGINSYEYDDYIQYKLYKKHNKKRDTLLNAIVVEKNAFHCQGLAKKLIVLKDYHHIPQKIIFI